MLEKLVDLIIQFFQFFQFLHIVHAYQKGVVLRFGRYQRSVNPGLVFTLPFFVDILLTFGAVDEPFTIGPQSLITKDGIMVVVSALFVVRVEDMRKFLLDFEGGNAGTMLLAHGALAELVESKTYAEITRRPLEPEDDDLDRPGMPSMSRRLATLLRRRVRDYGVSVIRAQVIELTKAKSIRLMGLDGGGRLVAH